MLLFDLKEVGKVFVFDYLRCLSVAMPRTLTATGAALKADALATTPLIMLLPIIFHKSFNQKLTNRRNKQRPESLLVVAKEETNATTADEKAKSTTTNAGEPHHTTKITHHFLDAVFRSPYFAHSNVQSRATQFHRKQW